MKKTFKISEAIKIISEAIVLKYLESKEFHDDSATIRAEVNDLLDLYEKDGFKVNHGYDQGRCVRIVKNRVRERIKALEFCDEVRGGSRWEQ